MKHPDITPAQIVAAVAATIGLLVSQGLVTNHTAKLAGGLASIVVPFVWMLADAWIRHGRAKVAAAQAANGVATVASTTPTPPRT